MTRHILALNILIFLVGLSVLTAAEPNPEGKKTVESTEGITDNKPAVPSTAEALIRLKRSLDLVGLGPSATLDENSIMRETFPNASSPEEINRSVGASTLRKPIARSCRKYSTCYSRNIWSGGDGYTGRQATALIAP